MTQAGRLFGDFCRDVLWRHEEFAVELDRFKEDSLGTVRVASIYSVGLSEMVAVGRGILAAQSGGRLEVDICGRKESIPPCRRMMPTSAW